MTAATNETILNLCENSTDLRSFYNGFLRYAGNQTGAVSGVVWDCSSLPYRPVSQIQSSSQELLKVGISETEHLALISRAAPNKQSLLILPKPDPQGTVPSDHAVILISFVNRATNLELVELFLKQGQPAETYRDLLRSLETYCQSAQRFSGSDADPEPLANHSPFTSSIPPTPGLTPTSSLDSQRLSPQPATGPTNLPLDVSSKLDEYVHQIHRSLDLKETSVELANELQRVLECDRVTVTRYSGRRSKILAISGQPSVNQRSNTVQGLKKLANRILPLKKTFWYPDEEALPDQILEPLDHYLSLASTRSLIVVPIFRERDEAPASPDDRPHEPEVIGGLIIEHCRQQLERDQVAPAIETVTRHAADAYRNAYRHQQLLFYPIWKWLGKSRVVLAARNLKTSTAVVTGLTLAGLALAFWPADFRLNCDGQIVPKNIARVFAKVDGSVADVLVRHGDAVDEGQTLLNIKSIDFEYQQQELAGQIEELEQSISSAESQRLTNRSSEEKQEQQQNLQSRNAQLESLKNQQALVATKLENLTVLSPQKGQIVTWNVAETLLDRPVVRGEVLLEVADVDGDWVLELSLSDRKVGHLLEALQEEQANAKTENRDPVGLSVDFILAADPNQRFRGTISEIGTATEINPGTGQTVRVKVAIDASEFDIRQVRSGVTAYIHCGRRSLGYVWFHPVGEFLQRKVLFPFF